MSNMMKKIVISSVISGVIGLTISVLINYYLIPVPKDVTAHAMNNGISGLLSGFIGTFMAFTMYLWQEKRMRLSDLPASNADA